MIPTNEILSVQGLTKDFKDFSLKSVSFQLPRGYVMGFIGPNGSGKTTTIKLIMNLLRKDRGEIMIFGLDHQEHAQEIKERIGFVFDENHYYEELSIGEMSRIAASFYKYWEANTFAKCLKDFDLNPKHKIKNLSKGMKMKFSLAIALSHQAELLIMDEPTAGLDPLVRYELLDILTNLIQDEKKSVFFSTHITSDLDKVADFVTFLNRGQVILSAPKDDILDKYGIIKGSCELLTSDTQHELIGLKTNQYGFEGLIKDRTCLPQSFRGRVVLEKPTLEDIMLYTVRGNRHAEHF